MSPSCWRLGCITLGAVRLLSFRRGSRPYIPGPQCRRHLSVDVRVVTGVGASAQENMKSFGYHCPLKLGRWGRGWPRSEFWLGWGYLWGPGETGCLCTLCSHHHRALWLLRTWLCTFPRRNGGSLMRPRDAYTAMSCWRPLHWLRPWVRPSPLSQCPGQVSDFLLFSKASLFVSQLDSRHLSITASLSSVPWVPRLNECVDQLLSQVAPVPGALKFS